MNKYIKLAVLALAVAGLSACSEDEIRNIDVTAVPQVSDYADMVSITVDQETNYATFSFNGAGVYPVWIIDGKNYSTEFSFSRFYRKAGDYSVEVKVGNANGVSQGAIEKTFTVEKTFMSGWGGFEYDTPNNLFKNATKQDPTFYYAPSWSQLPDPSWTFDGEAYSVALPSATFEQWQAQMHIATDICLTEGTHYSGSLIFTATKDIKNVTVKIHPNGDDDDSHSFFPVQKVNLTAGEPVAYFFHDLPAVINMDNLVYTFDFGGNPDDIEITFENIVLAESSTVNTTGMPDVSVLEPSWAGADSADNLFSTANTNFTFYYAPGWSPIADPEYTVNGTEYSFTLPTATFEQWQAQIAFNTDIAIDDVNQKYDFKIMFESNVDLNGVTVKLCQTDNDGNYFFEERCNITADTATKFWMAEMIAPEAMPTVKLVLDFGGNPDGTEIKVYDIVLQKHVD